MDTLRWTIISYHDNSPWAMPLSVAGHTAHFIGNEMYVFFGYNPYHGYLHQVQVYSTGEWLIRSWKHSTGHFTDTKGWRHEASNSVMLGRFGHSSVVYYEADKRPSVFIYGGYNAPLNSYSYAITDELLLYDPSDQTWYVAKQLGRKTGVNYVKALPPRPFQEQPRTHGNAVIPPHRSATRRCHARRWR